MNYRDDALQNALKVLTVLNESFINVDKLRYTIGQFNVQPNVANVIPRSVVFSLDIRSEQTASLAYAHKIIERLVKDFNLEWIQTTDVGAMMLNDTLQNEIKKSATHLQLSNQLMVSGTGHDAQIMAKFVPSAMIFVPSIAGISHAPNEATDSLDLVAGFQVLKQTLYQLAY